MPTTAVNQLRYPALTDSPNGPLQIQNLALDIDQKLPVSIATMAVRPTTGLFSGYTVRPLNRPQVLYVYDGSRWMQQGLFCDASAAPAGSYVSKIEGTGVTNPTNNNGLFSIALPAAQQFTTTPLFASFAPGDITSNASDVIYAPGNSTGTQLTGFAYTTNGTALTTAQTFRANYIAVGYNT